MFIVHTPNSWIPVLGRRTGASYVTLCDTDAAGEQFSLDAELQGHAQEREPPWPDRGRVGSRWAARGVEHGDGRPGRAQGRVRPDPAARLPRAQAQPGK